VTRDRLALVAAWVAKNSRSVMFDDIYDMPHSIFTYMWIIYEVYTYIWIIYEVYTYMWIIYIQIMISFESSHFRSAFRPTSLHIPVPCLCE
jgi:hypothetical protein